jgi:hypothetical protein
MPELNEELSWLKTTAEEAAAAGRNVDVDPGYVLGLFDELDAKVESGREAINLVQTAHESQLTRMAQERARLQRKVDRLTAELEAAQRPPLGIEQASLINSPVWQLIAHDRMYVNRRQVVGHRDADNGDIHLFVETEQGGPSAAQRPPLGYAVGFNSAHGWTFNRDYAGPHPMRAGAEQELANEAEVDPGVDWKLLEIREAQP